MESELVIAILSGVFVLVGTKLWQKGNHLLVNGKKTDGVIVKNIFNSSRPSRIKYYPVVRFKTDKKEWITQKLSIGYSDAKPKGSKLELIYDPEEPTNVEINGVFQLKVLPRLFFLIGLAGLILVILDYLEFIDIFS